MTRTHNASVVGVLMMAGAACADVAPTQPTLTSAASASSARMSRTVVCHANAPGTYAILAVNEHAVAGHRSHGDALPGEPVPGMAGYQFDANCVAGRIASDLTGVWTGTYTWNCGGTLTGSAPITFVLTDDHTGRIAGTVSYLGGSSQLYDSYRIIDPILRADGTWLGGNLGADGTYARFTAPANASYFVNNQFDGKISPDFNTITGNTLNGDSSPIPEASGCSAAVGYSGTFVVARVM